jgi:hypothetical protein
MQAMPIGLACHLNASPERYRVKMTNALQRVRWRQGLAFCAAAVLVHYLAAGWVGAGMGGPAPARTPDAPVRVRLRAPPAPAQAALPVAPAAPAAEAGAAVPARQVQSDHNGAARPRRRAVAAQGKADAPPSAQLVFDVARSAGDVRASGEALLDWTRDGQSYRLRYQATLTEPAGGALLELASEGSIGPAGIAPRTMTERRRGRARTATHFDGQGNITFSASEHAVPMAPGAQDRATWPLQLAAIARAGPGQLAGGVSMLVGEDKDAGVYRFVMLGQEQIETGIGTLATWRLARLAQGGSYHARLDIWLAPGHAWYPVQLRSTEANGTVTTQTIRKIVVKEAGN